MLPEILADEFQKRGPWTTQFRVGDQLYGGDYDPAPNCLVDRLFQYFPTTKTILELGSFEGGHSFLLARHAAVTRVLGVEARPSNIDRARFARQVLRADNVEFVRADLEKADLSALGCFDLVVCIGVLYHMPRPWQLIRQIARVARHAYICSQYLSPGEATTVVEGYSGAYRDELGYGDPVSGLSPRSYWLTLDALVELLRGSGYRRADVHLNLAAKNLAHMFCSQDA